MQNEFIAKQAAAFAAKKPRSAPPPDPDTVQHSVRTKYRLCASFMHQRVFFLDKYPYACMYASVCMYVCIPPCVSHF